MVNTHLYSGIGGLLVGIAATLGMRGCHSTPETQRNRFEQTTQERKVSGISIPRGIEPGTEREVIGKYNGIENIVVRSEDGMPVARIRFDDNNKMIGLDSVNSEIVYNRDTGIVSLNYTESLTTRPAR